MQQKLTKAWDDLFRINESLQKPYSEQFNRAISANGSVELLKGEYVDARKIRVFVINKRFQMDVELTPAKMSKK